MNIHSVRLLTSNICHCHHHHHRHRLVLPGELFTLPLLSAFSGLWTTYLVPPCWANKSLGNALGRDETMKKSPKPDGNSVDFSVRFIVGVTASACDPNWSENIKM